MTLCFPQDWPGGVKDTCSGGKPGEERVHHPGSRQPSVVPWLKREPQRVSPGLFIHTNSSGRQIILLSDQTFFLEN